jgi:wyosine [tRNA(Phe)-imidazoG37] synthetase (radical SAM superfamily)
MPTFLFDKIIFGPVSSRRLGASLGINLLPATTKVCNFNCIYCECGWTTSSGFSPDLFPSRKQVADALGNKLAEMKEKGEAPDVITFAGNGEPTMHPEFPEIIDDSIMLRNKYFPEAKIAVLSNSTSISNPRIRKALLKIESNILKLDSAFDLTVMIHNQPRISLKVNELIDNLKEFRGELIIQTLFVRGRRGDQIIDNTTPAELEAWLGALEKIRPAQVMIYTISRDTPEGSRLEKIPLPELRKIAAMVKKLGIETQVSG